MGFEACIRNSAGTALLTYECRLFLPFRLTMSSTVAPMLQVMVDQASQGHRSRRSHSARSSRLRLRRRAKRGPQVRSSSSAKASLSCSTQVGTAVRRSVIGHLLKTTGVKLRYRRTKSKYYFRPGFALALPVAAERTPFCARRGALASYNSL